MNGPADLLIDTDGLPWTPIVEGIDFRLLFTSPETGRWTVLFRAQPGSFFPAHRHYGAGEYYVLKGRMEYRAGVAKAGAYGYEPLDVVHEMTTFPEYTELLFTNYGPVAFLAADGSVSSILDHALLSELAAA